MLVVSLPLSVILESAQAFHSVKTVGNGIIQPSDINCIWPGVFDAMVCTKPSITGINHSAVKQIINQLVTNSKP